MVLRFRSAPRMVILALLAFTSSACTMGMIAAFNNRARTGGENPLQGQELSFAQANPNAPFEGSSACTTWPIEDHVTVKATDKKLCLDATISHLESIHSDRTEVATFSSDPAGDAVAVSSDAGRVPGAGAGRVAGSSRKVGSCFSPSTHRASDIWLTTFSGCVPNESKTGAPVLTAHSTFLDVDGVHGWHFAAPGAPAAQASR